jgi:hypothetical protein
MQSHKRWQRREFIQTGLVAGLGLAAGCRAMEAPKPAGIFTSEALKQLPRGPAPRAVEFPHFPTRVHAFVWRNWDLVPVARLAAVLGVPSTRVAELGSAMGLGKPPVISSEIGKRAYITIIKRNWHLLPYEQLLQLLEWTPEELAFTLREDDFLYIKLGNLKPECPPLAWVERDPAVREQERWIAQTVAGAFGPTWRKPSQPLFGFVPALSQRTSAMPHNQSDQLRFCYSYFALYGDPLLEPDLDPYPDGYLARLAEAGVNSVWMQAVLYKLARFPWRPELSQRFEERLTNLRQLAARARKHGIGLYLYLNEPRAMPQSFFAEHPDLKGVSAGDHATLCVRQPDVQKYLIGAIESICRAVPELGGFFTITASENLTNCWSHGQGANCPRCREVAPAEVIAGTNALFQQGIDQAGGPQRLLAWDWGWADGWVEEIIRRLPAKASLMSVSEWSLPIERGGVKTEVGEYSLSAVGPGPRATRHWALARKRGLRVVAKVQAANSWELSAVPYVPAVLNTARHAANLRELGVTEIMLGWTLGGYPSPNLEVVKEVMSASSANDGDREQRVSAALNAVAQRRFGTALAPTVVQAWRQCSTAYGEFPFNISVVYQAPLQNGPSNLLFSKPTGYTATMVGFPYDDLKGWHGPYPPEVFASQLLKVADGFSQAAQALRAAVPIAGASSGQTKALIAEAGLMSACALHWRSVANQTKFVLNRSLLEKGSSPSAAESLNDILEDEIRLAVELHRLQSGDSRIGFEASNQYYYVPLDLAEKVVNCRWLQERWL